MRRTELSLPSSLCSICAIIQILLDEVAVKDPKVVHAFQSGKTIPIEVRVGFAKVDHFKLSKLYMYIHPEIRHKSADIAFNVFTSPGKLLGP